MLPFLILFHTSLSLFLAPMSASYSPPRDRMSSGHREETIHEKQPEQVAGDQDSLILSQTRAVTYAKPCYTSVPQLPNCNQGIKTLPFVSCLSFWNHGVSKLSSTMCTWSLCAIAAQVKRMAIPLG